MLSPQAISPLLTHARRAEIIEALTTSTTPPWRPLRSRDLARLLGVSIQSLANWRVRDTGPTPLPHRKGGGNRMYYRPDEIVSWLGGRTLAPWQVSQEWLARKGLEMEPISQASTEWLIEATDAFV